MIFPNPQQTNIFEQSADAYSTGTQSLQHAANPYSMGFTMNQFLNPYYENVIGASLDRLNQQKSRDLNNVKAQAAQANAFGGARHGLVEAQLMDDYQMQSNELVSRLLQEGYNTSAGLAAQQLGLNINAGQSLNSAAQTGYNLGTGVNQNQLQAGNQQQFLMQQVLDQISGQVQGNINYPSQSLGMAMAGLTGNPLAGNTTTSQTFNPGLFNYLQMGAGTYAAGK